MKQYWKRTACIVRGRPFAKGFDPRRHDLTIEEKRRGGYTTWWRYMVEWHRGQGLAFGHPRPRKERRR